MSSLELHSQLWLSIWVPDNCLGYSSFPCWLGNSVRPISTWQSLLDHSYTITMKRPPTQYLLHPFLAHRSPAASSVPSWPTVDRRKHSKMITPVMYINHRPNLCVLHRLYSILEVSLIHVLKRMVFIGTSSPSSFWLLSSLFLDGSLSGSLISKRISSTGKISSSPSLSNFYTVALKQCLQPFQQVH